MGIVLDKIEVLALKKLAIVCGALAQQLPPTAAREQRALTSVLVDVVNRAEIDNARMFTSNGKTDANGT